ncbi:UDP-N-acetylglucosamine 2-epimerase [Succinispira mobilis]|uniref:UDP-N-acetylglucosamine 2-epimerase n=1 Tax=Succinispira mobilis TaxID=78120 RepID=UPI00037CB2E0|nr:UDP-N-acetylglucosamine 2-epimerase [Succinispira mobilis]
MVKRKICVVTGTRAEYGLLYWLMREIQEDAALQLQLIVTGMHLSTEFGLTYQVIESDGFNIDAKIEMLLASDTPVGITKSMGLGLIGFADALANLKPDIVVVLGDRYEILVAAQAALVANIPLAHIHGGELTEGLIDDSIRHSLTKMSHLHFTATEKYKRRVIQLGEREEFVFNFGAMCIDNLIKTNLLSEYELEDSLGISLDKKVFLVTYHPVTLEKGGVEKKIRDLLEVLSAYKDTTIIITKANSDAGGRLINELLEEFANTNSNVKIFTSLGQLKYLSLLKFADVVIGNSSSGIIEAPFFRTATVDIGIRQKGREKPYSVIECGETSEEIRLAIKKALSFDFRKNLSDFEMIYGKEAIAFKIKEILKNVDLKNILIKKFVDI